MNAAVSTDGVVPHQNTAELAAYPNADAEPDLIVAPNAAANTDIAELPPNIA